MAYLSLQPVSAAVYAKLNVAAMQALVSTRIYDDVPQAPTFPFLWYDVQEEDARGLGTRGLPLVNLNLHAFSQYEGMAEVQPIIAKGIELLRDVALTVSGYTFCGTVFYDRTVMIPESLIYGQKCKELVAQFRLYVEEP